MLTHKYSPKNTPTYTQTVHTHTHRFAHVNAGGDRWIHFSSTVCRMIALYYNHVLFVVISVVNLIGAFSPKVDLTVNLVEEIMTM